jgi:hypothetical protein
MARRTTVPDGAAATECWSTQREMCQAVKACPELHLAHGICAGSGVTVLQ